MNEEQPDEEGPSDEEDLSVEELRTRVLRVHAQLDQIEASSSEYRALLKQIESMKTEMEILSQRWKRHNSLRLWSERIFWFSIGSLVTTILSLL
jgi:hypothetical protein